MGWHIHNLFEFKENINLFLFKGRMEFVIFLFSIDLIWAQFERNW